MSADFSRSARQTVVVVVGLFVVPGLDRHLDVERRRRVSEDVLPDVLVTDAGRVVGRLAVLEDAALRPLLSEARQLLVPVLQRRLRSALL